MVKTEYTLLDTQQSSGTQPRVAAPVQTQAGLATRIGLRIKPPRQVNELETLDIYLPKFTGPSFLAIHNDASNLLLAHKYQPYGSEECRCDSEGRILTPRNNFKITRAAEGSGTCPHTETNLTQRITGIAPINSNVSAPWCVCSDCDCSLEGVPITPKPIYNTTGTCLTTHPDGVCSCDAEGNAFTPPVTYNNTGSCSSCACDGAGVSSYVAPFAVAPKEGQPTSVLTGSCSSCMCDSNGVISAADANCEACFCEAQTCDCQCIPRVCQCECPLFRKCTCGCELYRTHTCGCHQNMPDPVFQNALWSSYT